MDTDTNRRLLITIVGLGIALFCLDRVSSSWGREWCALRWARHSVLLLPNRKGPLITAAVCSVLSMVDVILSPTMIEGVPPWMGVSNPSFSLTAIWLPVLSSCISDGRKTRYSGRMTTLKRAYRRARKVASANQALVTEIMERMDTERSLRASETVLQTSRRELQQSREDLEALAGQSSTAQGRRSPENFARLA